MAITDDFILSSNNKTAFLESVSGDMPCIDVNTQRGVSFIVDSIADRNNIPKKKRTEGMLCYVKQLKKEYILINDPSTNTTKDDDWKLYSMMEKGFIISFYGREEDVPSGWHICDGTNGTPDLRDRFIVGAGNSYNPGSNGGTNENKLSIDQFPKNFTVRGTTHNSGLHDHISSNMFHRAGWPIHNQDENNYDIRLHASDDWTDRWGTDWKDVDMKTSVDGNHNHTFTSDPIGKGESIENRPPYYALLFIMKM